MHISAPGVLLGTPALPAQFHKAAGALGAGGRSVEIPITCFGLSVKLIIPAQPCVEGRVIGLIFGVPNAQPGPVGIYSSKIVLGLAKAVMDSGRIAAQMGPEELPVYIYAVVFLFKQFSNSSMGRQV